MWHRRLWLIDHGAALYVQHSWRDPAEHARRPFARARDHVLLPYAAPIAEADERLAGRLTAGVLETIVEDVPADWMTSPGEAVADRPDALRRRYVDYLVRRLQAPRPFVEEADRARLAA